MNFLSLIEAKRDGKTLSGGQIKEFVSEYTLGQIPDYQVAAFLMAVYFRGLDTHETTALTLAMRDSGDVLRFPSDPRPLVDKHSTGGVGDKVSLPLAPLLACLGFRVPMISGRGLGITGGTLDKLDSIPGFKTLLPTGRITNIVQTVGCVICGQTAKMVPADKGLYALRDVTATVPSLPLIVASILSKKLAEGLDALILDVKFGAAAFMTTQEKARELAAAMVTLGNQCGVHTRALLSDMHTPVGRASGNWLEVKESITCLENRSDEHGRDHDDLRELVLTCAAHLLVQTGKTKSLEVARQQAETCLASGEPRKKWDDMIVAQGADLTAFNQKLATNHTAPVVTDLHAEEAGFISHCDARILGEVIRDLGGGRMTQDAVVHHEVGVDLMAKPGEEIKAGGRLARIHAATADQAQFALERLASAYEIAPQAPSSQPLIREIIEA